MAGVVYPTFEASEERHDILADGVLEFTKDRACEGPSHLWGVGKSMQSEE
jgi:hypothetical protein